jgi:hypothetical protein
MPIPKAKPGSPYPIFIAGICYRSISEAANYTGLEFRGLYKRIEGTGGAPVVVKRQFVISDLWVREHIGATA